ncbi:MAG: type II toxin-antitoxin system RelE/ParE family toxin [Rhodospirillaceae bacterium]|nr:type II toxin-antitoxin system RelE/ParE family toxin [Rhodospirillaceae bacterium]
MFAVVRTKVFDEWLDELRDRKGRAVIIRRLLALELGHFGDFKPVEKGVLEMRIHFGPGYRVYLTQRGKQLIVLLCGGDKRSQKRDIAKAVELAENMEI